MANVSRLMTIFAAFIAASGCKTRQFNSQAPARSFVKSKNVGAPSINVDRLIELYEAKNETAIRREFYDVEVQRIIEAYEGSEVFAGVSPSNSQVLKEKAKEGKARLKTNYSIPWFATYTFEFACLAGQSHQLGTVEVGELFCSKKKEISVLVASREYSAFAEHFSRMMIMPTFASLTARDFLTTAHAPILFFGLTTVKSQKVDGFDMTPWNFFTHDITHAKSLLYSQDDLFPDWSYNGISLQNKYIPHDDSTFWKKYAQRSAFWKPFLSCVLAKDSSSPDAERGLVDLILFNIMHESPSSGPAAKDSSTHLQSQIESKILEQRMGNETLNRLLEGSEYKQKHGSDWLDSAVTRAVSAIKDCKAQSEFSSQVQ
jgi:hypothetical protein